MHRAFCLTLLLAAAGCVALLGDSFAVNSNSDDGAGAQGGGQAQGGSPGGNDVGGNNVGGSDTGGDGGASGATGEPRIDSELFLIVLCIISEGGRSFSR